MYKSGRLKNKVLYVKTVMNEWVRLVDVMKYE